MSLLEPWRKAVRIHAFAAIGGEPDPLALWPSGKELALPRIEGDALSFRVVTSRDDLAAGRFGILEPRAEASIAGDADVILVPGLAFDPVGGRLGRGKGFYDRYLASAPGVRVGVCFEENVIDRVPREPHDARMDYIVTPERIITCGRKNRS